MSIGISAALGAELEAARAEIDRLRAENERLRVAFARYNRSEGCGCCSDEPEHDAAENELAEILGCPRYSDNSGWDWRAFLRADAAIAANGG